MDQLDLWRAANNGTGKRIWFVCRGWERPEVACTASGAYRRFGSFEAARKVAVALNLEVGSA